MNPIDDIFKSGLDGKGSSYSANEWANMESLLDAPKSGGPKFKRAIWLSTAIILIVGGWFLNNSLKDSSKSEKPNLSNNESLNNSSIENEYAIKNKSEQEITFSEGGTDQNALNQKTNSPNQNILNQNNSNLGDTTKLNQNNQNKLGVEDHAIKNNQRKTRNNKTRKVKRKEPLRIYKPQPVDTELGNLEEYPEEIAKRPLTLLNNFSLSPKWSLSGFSNADNPKNEIKFEKREDISIFKRPVFNLAIEPYWSVNKHFRTFDADADLHFKNQEKAQWTNSYGLDLVFKGKKWNYKIGVGKLNLKEETNYEFQRETFKVDSSIRLVKKHYTNTKRGSIVALLETKYDTTITGSYSEVPEENAEVNFSYIRIPVSIQKELRRNRVSAFVDLGMDVFVQLKSNGFYVANTNPAEGELINPSLTNLATQPSLSSIMFNVRGGVGCRYHFNSQFALMGAINYSQATNSMFSNFTQKVSVLSFNYGLSYLLGPYHKK